MARSRTLALAAGLAAAAGLALAASRGAARGAERGLRVENRERGEVLRLRLRPGEVFSIVYQHSMYDQPVTEDFVVEEGRIVLQAVTSPSAAVREYFGITSAGERHAVARAMPEIVLRIAMGAPQRLRAGGVERSFLELGAHGDRLVLRPDPS